jgi:hypothetical protein
MMKTNRLQSIMMALSICVYVMSAQNGVHAQASAACNECIYSRTKKELPDCVHIRVLMGAATTEQHVAGCLAECRNAVINTCQGHCGRDHAASRQSECKYGW